jgi:hypothetical protein
MTAQAEGRLIEMFGAGTAAIVSPVGNIFYGDKLNAIPVDVSDNAVSKRSLLGGRSATPSSSSPPSLFPMIISRTPPC